MRKLHKEELEHLYLYGLFEISELADHYSCSEEMIQKNLDFYEIPKMEGEPHSEKNELDPT